MRSPAPIGLRGVRAVIFGTSALVLAVAAHVASGGSLPTVSLLLAVGVPVACASVVLTRKARGLGGILAPLALGQVLLHEAFMTASASSCSPVDAMSAHAAPATHGMSAVSCSGMGAMAAHGAGSALPSWLMLAMHACAVLATALLLAHGERIAVRLWTWLQPALVISDVRVAVRTHVASAFRVAQLVPRLRVADEVSRRGPPRRRALVTSPA